MVLFVRSCLILNISVFVSCVLFFFEAFPIRIVLIILDICCFSIFFWKVIIDTKYVWMDEWINFILQKNRFYDIIAFWWIVIKYCHLFIYFYNWLYYTIYNIYELIFFYDCFVSVCFFSECFIILFSYWYWGRKLVLLVNLYPNLVLSYSWVQFHFPFFSMYFVWIFCCCLGF